MWYDVNKNISVDLENVFCVQLFISPNSRATIKATLYIVPKSSSIEVGIEYSTLEEGQRDKERLLTALREYEKSKAN